MDSRPFQTVFLAAITYSTACIGLRLPPVTIKDSSTRTRLISSIHALFTTTAVLYTLAQNWAIDPAAPTTPINQNFLNDSQNPLIHGKSHLANSITAWETGYLLYDTIVLLSTSQRNDPTILAHHISLLCALGYLQLYIAKGKERGMGIIVSLLLMNASNPVLHWRWWKRKRDVKADVVFAVAFAACRFGTVWYVLREYGRFHGIGPLEALWRQRVVCQVGTGALVVANGFWWVLLVRGMVRRAFKDGKARR